MAIDIESCYRRYGPMVFRRCERLLSDPQKAEDAMQDVFVQLLRNQDQLHDRALSSLLYQIATRVCLNIIRSQKRHPENPGEDLLYRIAQAENIEENALVRQMLGRLFSQEKVSSRVIATLHLLDGLTLEQVSQETGLSVSGVRKRLRQLRHRLHELEEVR